MTATRTMRLGTERYPLVLPNLRDPRLHLAAVIVSVHVLGQTVLGFRVSVPQILTAILTCALLEVTLTFFNTRQIVWPASAMLTGSGVALIMRLVDMDRGEHWSWQGWHLFALVAGGSLLTKYFVKWRGSHLFNPSNVGLVVAFLVLGSTVIEPLDFWWAPLGPGLAAAYVIIVTGGLLITARLKLLGMATAFWLSLATGLGVLAASGHCFTAAWAVGPVCGAEFWAVVMTSPELLIFLFFMITDPKTIPVASSARITFAVSLGLVCSLLIAPARTEFGAKVGLLAGLVILTPVRSWFEGKELRWREILASVRRSLLTGGALGAALVVIGAAVVAAGSPARPKVANVAAPPSALEIEIDTTTLPPVSVSAEVGALNSAAAKDPTALAIDLAEALAIENEAMRRSDTSLLRAVADGQRLVTMERKVELAAAQGDLVVTEYMFDALHLEVVYTDGPQGGANLAFEASGELTEIHYDSAGEVRETVQRPFDSVFVLSPGRERWLLTAEIDPA